MRLFLMTLTLALTAEFCLAQGSSDCYYLRCDQGCNPHGYPYEFQSCPTECAEDLYGAMAGHCAGGITWFAEQGPDWNYTNGVEEGFQFGKVSFHSYGGNDDIYNVCMREGSCECDFVPTPQDPGGVLQCIRTEEFVWEDYTIRIDPNFECDPPEDLADEYEQQYEDYP